MVRIAVIVALGIIIFAVVSNQSVTLFMNFSEFGDVFVKPLYYSAISGLVLASIALVRVNFKTRRSTTWYAFRTAINFIKSGEYENQPKISRYSDFKMSKVSFALWQLTKVAFFAPFFGNILFGMTFEYLVQGNDLDLGSILTIFAIPFANIPMDGSYAQSNVVPMLPALTLLIPPLLAVIGLRLLLYVGISGIIGLASQYVTDARDNKPKFLSYISTIEIITGIAILWAGFTIFFSNSIDYNTKYAIAGTVILGAALIAFGLIDKNKARVIIYPTKRHVYLRFLTVAAFVVIVGVTMAVNNSIADAKKIEWKGPYIAQEIAMNRHAAELDEIEIINYDVKPSTVQPSQIQSIINENRETLTNIRLWDNEAALTKLKPALGQRNDINYADTDILRFDGTMYWTASTTPNVPQNVAVSNLWFTQHMVYTHANIGMRMLEADTGNIVDENNFFSQTRIYYGESGSTGIFDEVWSAYPVDRTTSNEVDQFFYNGTGGVDVAPPLSWIFEPNFMLSYPTTPIHIMKYKDVHDRMELLYPYFVYEFAFGDTPNTDLQKLDIFPVTDGKKTYWMMPLILALDTSYVPWNPNFTLKLVGYALIDSFNGDVQVIATGDDKFSEVFFSQYQDIGVTKEVPEWMSKQIRYPEEMFLWKISRFNTYHVTDPKTFIDAKQFYDIPRDSSGTVSPYYIATKPPGFDNPEFVGFQSLELRNSPAKNLVGYMIVQNDLENLGKMTFYSVPLDSPTKLLGPSGARETLEKDREYKNVKTLLQGTPRVGDNILYRIGDHEVYFIPVYTASTGTGVISQIGTIAAVGGTSVTGNFFVGLGDSSVQAFENYLQQLSGIAPSGQEPAGNQTTLDKESKIQNLEKVFVDAGLTVIRPTAISAPVEFREAQAVYRADADLAQVQATIRDFIQEFAPEGTRVYEWQQDTTVNFGVLRQADGVVESHYISIEVG